MPPMMIAISLSRHTLSAIAALRYDADYFRHCR